MTEKETENILLPILQNIQSDISVLKESVQRIDSRLGAMDHHLAGFYTEQRYQNDELDNHRGRLEAIEAKDPDPEL